MPENHPWCCCAGGAGNLIPIPGTGVAADTVAMTTLAIGLASVFGASLTEEAARALAINSVRQTVLKQPVRIVAKEVTKFVPVLGMLIAPAVSIAVLEAAGWSMAADLERRQSFLPDAANEHQGKAR